MVYDGQRNSMWFTDARLNALGSIDLKRGNIVLFRIPTNNSGIIGIVLPPDNKTLWFTEIIGNKIGSFDLPTKPGPSHNGGVLNVGLTKKVYLILPRHKILRCLVLRMAEVGY